MRTSRSFVPQAASACLRADEMMSPVNATVSRDVAPSGPVTLTTMTWSASYTAWAATCFREMVRSVP